VRRFAGAAVLASFILQGCVTSAPLGRAAPSTVGCARAVIATLPAIDDDKQLHCLAGARMALRCSVAEAELAAAGKEFADIFGRGNAEVADWRASRAGIACARSASDAESADRCCLPIH
jgi:hypothetical protein